MRMCSLVLVVLLCTACSAEAQPAFSNELQTLNDNQVPENWTLSTISGSGEISGGRLWARVTDGHLRLSRAGTIPWGINTLRAEWNSSVASALYGRTTWFVVNAAEHNWTCVHAGPWFGQPHSCTVEIFNEHGSMLVASSVEDVDDYHYEVSLEQGSIRFRGTRIRDACLAFDVMAMDSAMDVSDIDEVGFDAHTTSGSDQWIDNLQLTLGSEPSSVSISRIEVNQCIQLEDNSIPLVAGKPTVVRVYLESSGGAEAVSPGDVSLTVNGIPAQPKSASKPAIALPEILHDQQDVLDGRNAVEFYFNNGTSNPTIPLEQASYNFEAVLYNSGVEVDRKTEPGRAFHATRDLRVVPYGIKLNGTTPVASVVDFMERCLPFLRATYPVAEVSCYPGVIELINGYGTDQPGWEVPPLVAIALNTFLMSPADRENLAVGLVDSATVGDDWAFGYTVPLIRSALLKWRSDNVASTLAHEFGHVHGLYRTYHLEQYKLHPENGLPVLPQHNPFDVSAGQSVKLQYTYTYDFMGAHVSSYWVIPSTYTSIYLERLSLLGRDRSEDGDQLLVCGVVSLSDSGAILNCYTGDFSSVEQGADSGAYRVEMCDYVTDSILYACLFAPVFETQAGDSLPSVPFVLPMSMPSTDFRLKLWHDQTLLSGLEPSLSPPEVDVLLPVSGQNCNGEETVAWSMSDPDGDIARATVYYSANGVEWVPLGVSLLDTTLLVDFGELAGGTEARIRVQVEDGLRTAEDTSASFVVPGKSPLCSVVWPSDGDSVVEGQALTLVGLAPDGEDGDLTGDSMGWSSSIAGYLGEGTTVVLNSLSAGEHIIELRAEDSDGMIAYDSVAITVLADSDADGMPDDWEIAYNLEVGTDDSRWDPDNDEADNACEWYFGCDPWLADSDGDTYVDGFEIAHESDPADASVTPACVFLSDFSLVFPSQVAVADSMPTFVWQSSLPSSGGVSCGYVLYIDTDSSFPGPFTVVCSTSSFLLPIRLWDSTSYYWRVKAADQYGHFVWCEEIASFTTAFNCEDGDGDGVCTATDNCPEDYNPDQWDSDGDGIGDVCDGCCVPPDRGNVDGDPQDQVSLGDLTVMIDHLFISFGDLDCWEEGNVDESQPEGENSISLGDLTVLIDHLFISFAGLPPCP